MFTIYPIILFLDNGASFGTAGQYGGKHKMPAGTRCPDFEERQEAKKMKLEDEGEDDGKEEEVKEEPEEMEAEDEQEAKVRKIQETEEKMKIITENRL